MAADTDLDLALALAVAEGSDDDDFQDSGKQLAVSKQGFLMGRAGKSNSSCKLQESGDAGAKWLNRRGPCIGLSEQGGRENRMGKRSVAVAGGKLRLKRKQTNLEGRNVGEVSLPKAVSSQNLCSGLAAERKAGTGEGNASLIQESLMLSNGSQLNALLMLCSRAGCEGDESICTDYGSITGVDLQSSRSGVETCSPELLPGSVVSKREEESGVSEEEVLTQVSLPTALGDKRRKRDVFLIVRSPLPDISNKPRPLSQQRLGERAGCSSSPSSRIGARTGTHGDCWEATEFGAVCGSPKPALEMDDAPLDVSTPDCPICGLALESKSLQQMEAHTNSCLDKLDGKQQNKKKSPEAGLAHVLQWLEKHNLSKYADVFVKEEIDWDTLQLLTEEDLQAIGITALGPRRRIISEILALKSAKELTSAVECEVGKLEKTTSSSKKITDFFGIPASLPQRTQAIPKHAPVPDNKPALKRNGRLVSRKASPRVQPWMCIPGTTFRVDAFRHLTADCVHWFLTHFHTDHYQGLTKAFRHGKIYCSAITAALVNLQIGVPPSCIQIISLNEEVSIDGVKVTFIDANHCPGSVMILFEPPNGRAVLHTGDFRYCSRMANEFVLQSQKIHTLILDTTYCDPQYDFPEQDAAVQFVIDAIQAESFNPKTLFLIGTYTIGKERVFLEVAQALQRKVYVGAAKRRLLTCMKLDKDEMRWLTDNDHESQIHVVPLWSIANFKRMGSISRHYNGRYNSVVAFSLTGWNVGRDKKRFTGRRKQQGTIIRYEVPYSEHCSFAELKKFVEFIKPACIIPSVVQKECSAILLARLQAPETPPAVDQNDPSTRCL